MKVGELREVLKHQSKQGLIELVVDLYKHNDKVKERLGERFDSFQETRSHTGNVASLAAMKAWLAIPESMRSRFVQNVYCRRCGETTIRDYTVELDQHFIVLEGVCAHCGSKVARSIERD